MRLVPNLTLCWTRAGRSRPSKRTRRMITIFKTVTATKEHSRRRSALRAGRGHDGSGCLVLGLIGPGSARGQGEPAANHRPGARLPPPTKTGNLRVNGPSDVLQALLVFQPGGETGWHIHPWPGGGGGKERRAHGDSRQRLHHGTPAPARCSSRRRVKSTTPRT